MSKQPRSTSRPAAPGTTAQPEPKVTTPIGDVDPLPTDGAPQQEAAVDRDERIRRAAYRRYEERGHDSGDSVQDWLDAEREIDDQAPGRPTQPQQQ